MNQAMIASAVGSSTLNTLLTQTLPLSKEVVIVLTLGVLSIINYLWIGWIVQQSKPIVLWIPL